MADAADTNTETTADNFEDAFARLAEMADGQEPPKTEETAAAPASEEGKESSKPVENAEISAEPPAEEPENTEQTPENKFAAPAGESEEILERLARLVKDTTPAAPPQAAVQPPQEPEPTIYTKEEQELLSSYEKDWPEVAKAEALRRKAEYRELVNYVFSEVAKELRPVVDMVQTVTQRTHLDDLKATVTDYDDVRDKVITWVEQQPAYLQVAYKHVIEQGTVDEVADLVDRYKRETGVAARPAPVARKTESELPTVTKQAAAALAPVSSKRSASVLQTSDPDDFESAFASFASKM